MHRFRQLLNRRLLQQSQCSLPSQCSGLCFPLQQWLPLQRDLSISCPSLYSSNFNSGSGGNRPGGGGDGSNNDGDGRSQGPSAAYNTISDILNVTTKTREEDSWVDKRASNDLSNIDETEDNEKKLSESIDPRPVLNYASGPGGTTKSGVIMGIETSCDDTGVAVVNTEKQILGEGNINKSICILILSVRELGFVAQSTI